MRGILLKTENGFDILDNVKTIASTYNKMLLDNEILLDIDFNEFDAIFNNMNNEQILDLCEEDVHVLTNEVYKGKESNPISTLNKLDAEKKFKDACNKGVVIGFNKAQELIKNKTYITKSSIQDINIWLSQQKYQKEYGEQEYMMYFDVDIPKIINDYINHVSEQNKWKIEYIEENNKIKITKIL